MDIFTEGIIEIRFAGAGRVPASVVAESIEGWAGICERVPSILAQLHPAFRYLRLVPFIESVECGSLDLKTFLRLVAKDDQAAEAMANDIDRLKKDATDTLIRNVRLMNEPGKKIIYAAIGGAAVYGMLNVSGYLSKEARTSISNASGIVINNSAVHLGVTPAKVYEIVELATRDNKRLANQTLSALRPAAALDGAAVQIGGEAGDTVIEADAARIVSRVDSESLKPRIEVRQMRHVRVDIRALDLDKKNSGWAAVLPDLSPRRIPLTISDHVKLKSTGLFIADVDVDIAIDLDGHEKPRKAHLLRIEK